MTLKDEPKVAKLLRTLYHHENVRYNAEEDRSEVSLPASISAEDLAFLDRVGLAPNTFESLNHDDAVKRLMEARDRLSLEIARDRFIEGVGGKRVRGRQTLMSFLYARGVEEHAFSANSSFGSNLVHASGEHCEHCGLPASITADRTGELMGLYLGHSSNEGKVAMLYDLEEAADDDHVPANEDSKAVLRRLLDAIADASGGEAPSALEKRIGKLKLVPKSDRYKRHGILQTLAEWGAMPNDLMPGYYDRFTTLAERITASGQLTTSHRSDIVLPLAGWSGDRPRRRGRADLLLHAHPR